MKASAAARLSAARGLSFGPACHGRLKVPAPNTSLPGQQNVCQKQTAKRSWSSMRLPMTMRSLSYQR